MPFCGLAQAILGVAFLGLDYYYRQKTYTTKRDWTQEWYSCLTMHKISCGHLRKNVDESFVIWLRFLLGWHQFEEFVEGNTAVGVVYWNRFSQHSGLFLWKDTRYVQSLLATLDKLFLPFSLYPRHLRSFSYSLKLRIPSRSRSKSW